MRIELSLPAALAQTGDSRTPGSTGVRGGHLGDLRIGLRSSLFGGAHDAFAVGLQADVYLPTGFREAYAGAGSTRGQLRLIVSGVSDERVVYSVALGAMLAEHHSVGLGDVGHSLTYAAGIALLFADGHLQVGPELFGSTVLTVGTSPLEALLGLKYRWNALVFGAGIGAGLTGAMSTAQVRGLLSIAWEPKPQPTSAPAATPTDCSAAVRQAIDALASRDRDGDGVIDSEDACSLEAGASSDDPLRNGCPVDGDQDGVPDSVDACPGEPGPKANRGCPAVADRDCDEVLDTEDLCPDERGSATATKKGCPATAELAESRIELSEQVQFATGKADLLPQSEAILLSVAKVMRAHPELVKVSIDGFTDDRGEAAFNMKLSGDRAAAVVEWLVKTGGID